jgi:hypothetical protein
MGSFLVPLSASSLSFAMADILCDVCIAEVQSTAVVTAAEETDGAQGAKQKKARLDDTFVQTAAYQPVVASAAVVHDDAGTEIDEPTTEDGLSGEQDAAIAGVVTIIGLLVSVVYTMMLSPPGGSMSSLTWRPTTHVQFWLALLGGAAAFLHNLFLLKAFEGAPSTVLLPLVQVASVSVLVGSSFLALYRHESFITPPHAVAYALMFVGGILPATSGQLSLLFTRAFWGQRAPSPSASPPMHTSARPPINLSTASGPLTALSPPVHRLRHVRDRGGTHSRRT